LLEPVEGALDDVHRWAERKPHVVAKTRGARAALAGVHVEELARNRDDLLVEGRAEEARAVRDARRQRRDVAPDVKRTVRHSIDAHAEAFEPREHPVALLAKRRMDRERLLRDVLLAHERNRRALERLAPAAVEERAGARERLDDALRPERPRDAPARVTPVLREAVEDDDRIAIDVLDVARSALHREDPGLRAIHVMRIELVE